MNIHQSNHLEECGIRSALIENGLDPDVIREFLEEQIELSRSTDRVSKDIIGRREYYQRELRYTQIEHFIIKLK